MRLRRDAVRSVLGHAIDWAFACFPIAVFGPNWGAYITYYLAGFTASLPTPSIFTPTLILTFLVWIRRLPRKIGIAYFALVVSLAFAVGAASALTLMKLAYDDDGNLQVFSPIYIFYLDSGIFVGCTAITSGVYLAARYLFYADSKNHRHSRS